MLSFNIVIQHVAPKIAREVKNAMQAPRFSYIESENSFEFQVDEVSSGTVTTLVHITVHPVLDPPSVQSMSLNVDYQSTDPVQVFLPVKKV